MLVVGFEIQAIFIKMINIESYPYEEKRFEKRLMSL